MSSTPLWRRSAPQSPDLTHKPGEQDYNDSVTIEIEYHDDRQSSGVRSPPDHSKSIGTSKLDRLRRANSPPSGDGADPRQERADKGQKPVDIVKVFHDWLQYFMKVNQFKNARGSQQFEEELNARKR